MEDLIWKSVGTGKQRQETTAKIEMSDKGKWRRHF